MATLKTIGDQSIYEIPLQTAISWTNRWRDFQASTKPNPDDSKKAFCVNIAELQDVINNIPGMVDHIRFYFGLDEDQVEHMVLVGVDSQNTDLYEFEGKSYVYDFTRPCPSTCDLESPLFSNQ